MNRGQTEKTETSDGKSAGRSVFCILFVLQLFATPLHAQLVDGDTTYYYNYHPLGTSKSINYDNWPASFDGWVVLLSSFDSTDFIINITGLCGRSPDVIHGHISIWDGDPVTGTRVVNNFTGSTLTDTLRVRSHRLTMHLQYDAFSFNNTYSLQRHIEVSWNSAETNYNPNGHTSEPNPYLCQRPAIVQMRTANVTSNQATLILFGRTPSTVMRLLGTDTPLTSDTVPLTGLAPNTRYYVTFYDSSTADAPWCWYRTHFTTLPSSHHGIPAFDDLASSYVRGESNGSFGFYCCEPEYSAFSYHTLNRDTLATDGICYDHLRLVPPGKPWSIRLGNWLTQDNESIEYFLHVDTNDYSLIMLYYAAILQNPDHSPSCQPFFSMVLLDGNGDTIDPQCGAARFVANSDLGWYQVPPEVLWKDWTTVGINLIPYHGQDIRLKLTSKDCCQGGHFGYAYFYAECQQPVATAELCGTVDTNTFTAPDGFYYLWYAGNDITDTISTDQTVTYPTSEGTIRCRLSFVENPACYLTMNTYITNFWPQAEVDTVRTVTYGCAGYEVHFANRSTILGDDSLPRPYNPPCDGAWWDFGDGNTSSDYAPTHIFLRPGTYTVTLIASLDAGCSDTTQYTVVYADPGYVETVLPIDTFCYSSTYQWRNQQVGNPSITEPTEFSLRSQAGWTADGCDSFVVQPLVQLPPDSTLVIYQQPNCDGSRYWLTAVTQLPVVEWSSTPHDSTLDGNEHSSLVYVEPVGDEAVYTLTSFYIFRGDSLFCPTSKSVALHPIKPPKAALKVVPVILTYTSLDLTAMDLSDEFSSRQWSIISYPGSDTIRLVDTRATINYTASASWDSLTVLLAVSNGICTDTATATLHISHAALWIPNVFTPSQPTNNRFFIVNEDILEGTLTIYNRHGLKVYSSSDPGVGWDGTHNGTPCPQGAYPWYFRYRTVIDPDRWHEVTGTVTLLR